MTAPSAPSRRRGFPWGLTVAVAVCLPILMFLGAWQVQRLHWKEAMLARIAALKAAPAGPLEAALAASRRGDDVDFVRVRARCSGLDTAPWIELHALKDGAAGVRLISVCRNSGGAPLILVDRGFVGETISARPPRGVQSGAAARDVEVVGVLRRPGRPSRFAPPPAGAGRGMWFARDAAAMSRALGASAVPQYFLMAETSTNPEWLALKPAAIPDDIPNNHLGYALTWFGLALALAGVYGGMLVQWRRGRAARTADSG